MQKADRNECQVMLNLLEQKDQLVQQGVEGDDVEVVQYEHLVQHCVLEDEHEMLLVQLEQLAPESDSVCLQP